MAITVCIELDDDGAISVGAEPPEAGAQGASSGDQSTAQPGGDQSGMTDLAQPPASGEESAEADYMRPAKSIDQALSIARDLLRSASQVGGAITAPPGGADQQDAATAAFAANRGK